MFIFIEQFFFSLLTCFLFATTRWNCHEILGLLSFRANAEVVPSLTDLQVRSSGAVCQNSKAFNYKFVAQNNSVKNINAKQIPMLIEVKSLNCPSFYTLSNAIQFYQ